MTPSLRLVALCAASQALKPTTAPRRALFRAPAAIALANALPAVAADTKTISVPADWVKLSGDPGGGRKMELYADPNNADTNAFALITPVRGDYTSLGSFGSVEVVQDTVMPAAPDITYDVIKSEAQTGK